MRRRRQKRKVFEPASLASRRAVVVVGAALCTVLVSAAFLRLLRDTRDSLCLTDIGIKHCRLLAHFFRIDGNAR